MGLFGGSDKDVVIRFLVDSDDAVKGFQEIEGGLEDVVGSALKFGTIFAGAVAGAVVSLGELAERGDQINDVSDAFDGLSKQAGTTASVLLTKLQTATDEQTSAFDLMRLANDSLQKGLKPDQFVNLAAAAKKFADETGGNATNAINTLGNAVEAGNLRLGRRFNLLVDEDKALQAYATRINKTVKELGPLEQIEARREGLLKALTAAQTLGAKSAGDAGDAYAVLKTKLGDALGNIAQGIDKNPKLTKTFKDLADQVAHTDFKPLIEALSTIVSISASVIAAVTNITTKIAGLASTLSSIVPGVVKEGFSDAFGAVGGLLDVLVGNKTLSIFAEDTKKVGDAAFEAAKWLNGYTSATEEAVKKTGEAPPVLGKTTEALKEQEEQLKKITKELDRRIKVLTSAPDLSDVIKGFNFSVDDVIGKGDNGLVDALGQGIGEAIAQSLKLALSGGNSKDFKQTTKDILDPLSKASGAAFGGTAGFAIGGPIGAAIGASIGSAAADAIDEAIVDGLFSAFGGGDSAGTKARKQIDAFFADIFEPAELAVLIGGKLTEVSDLVFSGNQEGGLFAGLPAAAQAAFEGVGVAFEQLNGIALDLGVNVGNVLANNLGGSLNNLGIALQTTGQSAEQLGDQIIQAGLKGDLSFQQVASSLHGVELAMQKGIPDGVGLVVQAFDNLKNAGVAGGRVSTDAMRDLADELLEVDKNANGIDALGQKLLDSGVATDEVTQLMEALKSVGLDTVQKLSEATDRQLFEALARLQTIEFPFAQTSKDLDELLDKLDRIPDSIEKDITFNVKTNYQGDSRTVLNEAGVSLSPGGQGVG